MYTSGLARTTMSRYVNLNTFRLAASAYIFYFIYLLRLNLELYIIPNRDGWYGLYLDDTLLDGFSARCPTFDRSVHRVRGRVGTSRLSWKCGQ
jgi:hypothetical protein